MKKKWLLYCLCLLFVFATTMSINGNKYLRADQEQAQSDQSEWTKRVDISKSSRVCAFPKVTGDELGNAHAIWNAASGGRGIYYTTNKNGEWGTPEFITPGGVRVKEGPWPEIALDTKGNVCVVYTAVTDGNYEIVYTRKRGNSWDSHENVSATPRAGSVSSSILIDSRNNDYFIHWQDDIDRPTDNASYWRTYVRYKEGGEGKWRGAGAIGDAAGRDYGPEAAMNSEGTMYAVWGSRRGGISHVNFVQSKTPKVNSSWTKPLDISGFSGVKWAEPQIACDNNGNVYVVWQQDKGGNREIFFRKRVNGTWHDIENVSQTEGPSEFPTVAADRETGKIYVAWHDRTPNNWEIYLREFEGGKWGEIQNMSNTGPTSARPDLYCDSGGGIHLVYLENEGETWNVFYRKKEGTYNFPIYPPLNVQVDTVLDDTDASTPTKTNTITWVENPENALHSEITYLLYRKEHGQNDNQYEEIATLSGDTYSYEDENLPTSTKYWYRLKSFSQWDEVSEDYSNTATENWIWPVLAVFLKTEINEFLFFKEKINTVSWTANPLNDAITIDKYNIYRKEESDPDSDFALLASVEGNVLQYVDQKLPLDKQFAYFVMVVDIDGNESLSSQPVSED